MGNHVNKIISFSTNKTAGYNAEAEKENNIIGQRIDQARKESNLNYAEFSELLERYGVSLSTSALSKWTQGKSQPSAYQLLAICHALNIEDGVQYFSGEYKPELNADGLRKVREYRDDLIASGKYRPHQNASKFIKYIDMPISNLRVSAGTGAFLDEGNFETISFPEDSVPVGADFGVRVSGNSMEPVYHDGQIVWVKKCSTLQPGQVGVFLYDGEGYLKAYGEQEPDESIRDAIIDSYGTVRPQPILISYNQEYEVKEVLPGNTFQILGKVL